ncbi:hypothetical protein Glove_344g35 [Diversispora epigaea]|uniref:Uncharacterized protein n=1 Tax=Diversispora epigaea TaxID=1348612 RepID=A0A397HG66_9GLOM|nr:hypothetical protein Glove_344g35 [Diversispora epigaea]
MKKNEIENEEAVIPLEGGTSYAKVMKETSYFYVHGSQVQQTQFPLQNTFALTVLLIEYEGLQNIWNNGILEYRQRLNQFQESRN